MIQLFSLFSVSKNFFKRNANFLSFLTTTFRFKIKKRVEKICKFSELEAKIEYPFSALSNISVLFIQIGKNEKSDKTRWCESIKWANRKTAKKIYTQNFFFSTIFFSIQSYAMLLYIDIYKILSSYLNRTRVVVEG
jgi:hypothetical protein